MCTGRFTVCFGGAFNVGLFYRSFDFSKTGGWMLLQMNISLWLRVQTPVCMLCWWSYFICAFLMHVVGPDCAREVSETLCDSDQWSAGPRCRCASRHKQKWNSVWNVQLVPPSAVENGYLKKEMLDPFVRRGCRLCVFFSRVSPTPPPPTRELASAVIQGVSSASWCFSTIRVDTAHSVPHSSSLWCPASPPAALAWASHEHEQGST